MTPEERGKELLIKFINANSQNPTQCAIICCNEIIDALELALAPEEVGFQIEGRVDYTMTGGINYWQQVKTSLQSL